MAKIYFLRLLIYDKAYELLCAILIVND